MGFHKMNNYLEKKNYKNVDAATSKPVLPYLTCFSPPFIYFFTISYGKSLTFTEIIIIISRKS